MAVLERLGVRRPADGERIIASRARLRQVIHLVGELVKRKIRFTAVKENIPFEEKGELADQVMVALVGLSAEVGRNLISESYARRTGLARGRDPPCFAKAGVKGLPLAKIVGVRRPTIHRFIKTRRLRPHP